MGTVLDQRQRNALERAFAAGLVERTRRVGTGHWLVPSQTAAGAVYHVTANRDGSRFWCSCTAGLYRRPCAHAGAAYVAFARERGGQQQQTRGAR